MANSATNPCLIDAKIPRVVEQYVKALNSHFSPINKVEIAAAEPDMYMTCYQWFEVRDTLHLNFSMQSLRVLALSEPKPST